MNRQDEQNDVLRDVVTRLDRLKIGYMLTGSMALVHYAIPRTTVDIDMVLAIRPSDVDRFISAFDGDYYVPHGRVREAVLTRRMFNILNQKTILKVDCVVLKDNEFQQSVFRRRHRVSYSGDFDVWIITKGDLILSKLLWAKESRSEKQMLDVASLIRNPYDTDYIESWTQRLGVSQLLNECRELLEKNYADGYDS